MALGEAKGQWSERLADLVRTAPAEGRQEQSEPLPLETVGRAG
jgi:hypothetical protein